MEFLTERCYTALNADELKPGSKVIVANTIDELKQYVEDDCDTSIVTNIMPEFYAERFNSNNKNYNLAYLISVPEEKDWIVYLCRHGKIDPYLTACRSDCWEEVQKEYGAKTKLFEGTEDEVDKWYVDRRQFADVIAAWEDGKTIQFFDNSIGDWSDIEKPKWSTNTQYRIKPEGLKWTDLKVGDIVHRIDTDTGTDTETIVIAIDKDPATGFHVMICDDWITDECLANTWEKVK